MTKLFEQAYEKYTKIKESEEIEVSDVAWFHCSIEKNLSLNIGKMHSPNQVVIHESQTVSRVLNFGVAKKQDEIGELANELVSTVLKLTGDWVTMVDCDEVMILSSSIEDN